MGMPCRAALLAAAILSLCHAQSDPKDRLKNIRDLYKRSGAAAIPEFRGYLKDSDDIVRREACKALVAVGTQASLDPLMEAAKDPDPEIQSRAVEGLVNFYYPGYVPKGLTSGVRRIGKGIKGKFTDTNDQVIEPYVTPRPEVLGTVTGLVKSGATLEVKAVAARAAGVLRNKGAVPALLEAVRSKDSAVLYESLVAIQKIRDPKAAPGITFLLQDLNERVQLAAIETTGLLRNKEALPALREALSRAKSDSVRAAALSAIAMIPDASSRSLYETYLADREDDLRASAAEGLARLNTRSDRDKLAQAFEGESKMKPRLAMAFGAAMLGARDLGELSPLSYLLNTLNSSSYRGVASAYLEELARERDVRTRIAPTIAQRTRDEKVELAAIFGRSGGDDAIPVLEQLTKDSDSTVAQAAAVALRNLRARSPL